MDICRHFQPPKVQCFFWWHIPNQLLRPILEVTLIFMWQLSQQVNFRLQQQLNFFADYMHSRPWDPYVWSLNSITILSLSLVVTLVFCLPIGPLVIIKKPGLGDCDHQTWRRKDFTILIICVPMTIVLSHKRAEVKCLSKIYHEILSKLWLSIQYITIEKITLYI